jgi:2-iminobutanoate/2-iminopropanoate deaminase
MMLQPRGFLEINPSVSAQVAPQFHSSRMKSGGVSTMKAIRLAVLGLVLPCCLTAVSASSSAKTYVKNDAAQRNAFSISVATEGGKTVWLGGQTGAFDDDHKSLAGNFEAQAKQVLKLLTATMEKNGGKLSDIVNMTVFITDVRDGPTWTKIRREAFGDNFPGSALITVSALQLPDAKIEVQAYAVIGDK